MISLVIDLHWLYLKTMKIETLLVYSSFCKSIQMDYVKCSNWLLHCIFSDLEVGIMFWEIKKRLRFTPLNTHEFCEKIYSTSFPMISRPIKTTRYSKNTLGILHQKADSDFSANIVMSQSWSKAISFYSQHCKCVLENCASCLLSTS